MDDQRLGAALRAARIRRRLRQADVARAAEVSTATVSRLERGHVETVAVRTLRAVARSLEIRIELVPRSRTGELDRLVNARHAALAEAVIGLLRSDGWLARPEVSFNVYGERGVIDLLAWHATTRTVLVIELKTAVVDLGELLGTLDRKRRLATTVARQLRWEAASVGVWLAIADGATNRRRVAQHVGALRAALPDDGRSLRAWLARPAVGIAALSFVADGHPGQPRTSFATPIRVPTRAARPRRARVDRVSSGSPAG
jgi:transcriptional regulator with XRE-family HTH domain